MLKFIRLFLPAKVSNFSLQFNEAPNTVFNGITDTSNWYLFDFHNLIYLHDLPKGKVIVTKDGRGILKMKCNATHRQMAYSIMNDSEGLWKFEVNVATSGSSSILHLKCQGPGKISNQIFNRRMSDLTQQLERFKSLMGTKKLCT